MNLIHSIDHVNLVVEDLNAMTTFYEAQLGLNLTKRVTISDDWIDETVGLKGVKAEVVYLEPQSGPRIELIKYLHPPTPPKQVHPPHAHGIRHIAFRVDAIDELVERLSQNGVKFFSRGSICSGIAGDLRRWRSQTAGLLSRSGGEPAGVL